MMGQSFKARSQTTKAQDISTAPMLSFAFLRVATYHRARSMSNPLFEYMLFFSGSGSALTVAGVSGVDPAMLALPGVVVGIVCGVAVTGDGNAALSCASGCL